MSLEGHGKNLPEYMSHTPENGNLTIVPHILGDIHPLNLLSNKRNEFITDTHMHWHYKYSISTLYL